ncbi:unnamed protein product [Cylicostephanus goldi]|uniref:Uncharacterized protein n=1 Tax=Cylicostephanus goldi TaxID=71465 RepID=A0A3P7QIJ0_CYLGO|nr:unnamed protein product [Cylicostephanus goldi]
MKKKVLNNYYSLSTLQSNMVKISKLETGIQKRKIQKKEKTRN